MSRPAVEKLLAWTVRDDFYLEAHRRIYDAIAHLAAGNQGVDPLTLREELDRCGLLGAVGGMAYVLTLSEAVPTATHADTYLEQVRDDGDRRRLIDGQQANLADAYERERAVDLLLDAEQVRLDRIRARRQRLGGPEVLTGPELLARTFEDPIWVVQDLLPVGVCLLAGPAKVKKSFFALCVGMAVSSGTVALGRFPVRRTDSLCVFLEDRFDEVQGRLEQLLGGAPCPEGLHIAQDCPRMDEGGEAWLDQWLREHPAVGYLVLDPFVRIRGGRSRDGNVNAYDADYADMAAFKRLTDRHQICLQLLHHTRKLPADDWLNQLNGSTGIVGAADAVMLLQGERGAGNAVLRTTGKRVRDAELALNWEDHSGWTVLGPAAEVARNQEQDEVFEVLRAAPGPVRFSLLISLLAERTGATEDACKKRLLRMANRGQIMRDGGLYWLAESAPPRGQGDSASPVPPVPTVPTCPQRPLSPAESEGGTEGQGGQVGTEGTGGTGECTLLADGPDADAALRSCVRALALDRGFPRLVVEGREVEPTEPEWAYVCRELAPGWLAAAAVALRELPP